MALQNAIALGIDAVAHCVKVDDAVPGIAEGVNAGMRRIGAVRQWWREYRQMAEGEIEQRRTAAADKLYAAGAHYVIDALAHLPGVIADSTGGWRTASTTAGLARGIKKGIIPVFRFEQR